MLTRGSASVVALTSSAVRLRREGGDLADAAHENVLHRSFHDARRADHGHVIGDNVVWTRSLVSLVRACRLTVVSAIYLADANDGAAPRVHVARDDGLQRAHDVCCRHHCVHSALSSIRRAASATRAGRAASISPRVPEAPPHDRRGPRPRSQSDRSLRRSARSELQQPRPGGGVTVAT